MTEKQASYTHTQHFITISNASCLWHTRWERENYVRLQHPPPALPSPATSDSAWPPPPPAAPPPTNAGDRAAPSMPAPGWAPYAKQGCQGLEGPGTTSPPLLDDAPSVGSHPVPLGGSAYSSIAGPGPICRGEEPARARAHRAPPPKHSRHPPSAPPARAPIRAPSTDTRRRLAEEPPDPACPGGSSCAPPLVGPEVEDAPPRSCIPPSS